MGTPVVHTFPDSPGHRNSNDVAMEDLRNSGFSLIECETVDSMLQTLEHPLTAAMGKPVAAVISGALDSSHTAFVTRFRRAEPNMFLAVYDRDACLDVKLRSMLNGRKVDMVTCWSDHLVKGLKGVVAANADSDAMHAKVMQYRAQIHDIFAKHDEDKSGMIDASEQASFAMDVAKLMEPDPSKRGAVVDKIWDTLTQIDKDGDSKISWDEFWRFVTKADEFAAASAPPPTEQPLVKFTAFVLVVLQRADGTFCLVDTSKGWWLIGGEVGMNESPEAAAIRYTQEQAGIAARLEGLLRVEFDQRADGPGSRMRTIYLARALNDYDSLKTVPDAFSRCAVWAEGAEVTTNNPHIPLAGSEPAVWFEYILKLGPIFPLDVLTSEGTAPRDVPLSAKAHSPFSPSHREIEKGGMYQTNLGPVYPTSP
jgi:ADP-ribose pyrophosphatase YjhB (NUDIX family)